MTSFVDASVLVAMLGNESDAFEQAARLTDANDLITSPVAIWEAITALVRRFGYTPDAARNEVFATIETARIAVVPIGDEEGTRALDAFARYGKGRHRANLNMGDCFAYACAITHDARLLYKGEDFGHTDLA